METFTAIKVFQGEAVCFSVGELIEVILASCCRPDSISMFLYSLIFCLCGSNKWHLSEEIEEG